MKIELTEQQLMLAHKDTTQAMQNLIENHTPLEEEHGLLQKSMETRKQTLEKIEALMNKPNKNQNNSKPNPPANPKPENNSRTSN